MGKVWINATRLGVCVRGSECKWVRCESMQPGWGECDSESKWVTGSVQCGGQCVLVPPGASIGLSVDFFLCLWVRPLWNDCGCGWACQDDEAVSCTVTQY